VYSDQLDPPGVHGWVGLFVLRDDNDQGRGIRLTPMVDLGFWCGVSLSPRDTISRMWMSSESDMFSSSAVPDARQPTFSSTVRCIISSNSDFEQPRSMSVRHEHHSPNTAKGEVFTHTSPLRSQTADSCGPWQTGSPRACSVSLPRSHRRA
jgi:hypothetical protein